MKRSARGVFAVALFLALSLSAWGQGTTSKVTGLVTDPQGALVAGALVTLTNEATNVSFQARTTEAGTYVFESVQVGTYSVTVEAEGFKKTVARGNQLTIGQPLTVNVTLELGDVSDTIEVTDTAQIVQTSTAGNFGNLVDTRALQGLPIVGTRGRNPLEFINFQPGVTVGANTGGGVHVHGSRDRAWNFTLDGIDTNETSAGGSNFSPLRANPESLAEFRVLTGQFTAEYGRNAGGQVTMITRSGTNEYHGDLFWLYRTPSLNANEWSNNRLGLGKNQFVQHIAGFSAGGPVIPQLRDKTFFFTNLQVLRASTSSIFTGTVYTQMARDGIFRYVTSASAPCPGQSTPRNGPTCVDSNGNPVPGITVASYDVAANDPDSLGLDPQIRDFIGLTPLPNDFNVGDGLNTAGFSWLVPGREEQYDWVFKIDHVLDARNTVFARWAMGQQLTFGDRVNGGNARFPGLPRVVDTDRLPRNLAINWRSNPRPNITNELVFGFNRFTFDFLNPDPNFAANPPFVLNNVTDPIFNFLGNLRRLHTWQWVDNFTYTRGAHAIKAGINFRFGQHRDVRGSVAGANVQPSLNFSTSINTVGASDFNLPGDINTNDLAHLRRTVNDLLGRVGAISQAFVSNADGTAFESGGTPYRFDARYPEYDFYIQDTWKLRPNLTVEFGLRWDLRPSPSAEIGRILVPNQPVFAGASSTDLRWVEGDLWDDDMNNLGPSIGIAWDPFGDGKTAVRASYRLAYDRFNTFVFSSAVLQSLPGQTTAVVNTSFGTAGGRVRDGLPTLAPTLAPNDGTQPAVFSTAGITLTDRNSLEMPQVNMWGLSLQRDLGRDFLFEINYQGRRGHNLFGAYDVNAANILAADPACGGETFLQAFVTVRAGGDSCLMNRLFSGDPDIANGSAFVRANFGTTLARGSVAGLAAIVSRRTEGGEQMIFLSGFDRTFLQAFSQFTGFMRVLDSNDFSAYHGMEIQLSRRFRDGLTFNVSYTLAKSLDNRSFDPTFTTVSGGVAQSGSSTPFDIFDRSRNYARSDFDRRHSLKSFWVYELPFGGGRRWANDLGPVLDRIIGGWQLNGILILASGRPFTVYANATSLSSVVSSPANCSGCSRTSGSIHPEGSSNTIFWFTPEERDRFSGVEPGQLGNLGRNFFETDSFFNLDLGIGKRTLVTEVQMVEFRFEMQNATNHPNWGLPTANITSSLFGRLLNPSNSSRKMQLVLKYLF